MTLEPKDKLDAMANVLAGKPVVGVVNGPEDETLDWQSISWRQVEDDVRRLRQRIFTATQAGDLKRVRSLQKLMLRSRSNTLLSVRRVTQLNAGRKTPGIDKQLALTPTQRFDLACWIQRNSALWTAWPVKRAWVPKSNGRRRPLGIPVLVDRVLQAQTVNALEPEWEARFEPRSYGFRPGRGCHDAIESIFTTTHGKLTKRRWVLDADLTAAFDRINHDRLLDHIGQFPARALVRQWLKAGVVQGDQFTPTDEGTPQGGVISPLLLNVALHGLEQAAGVRYRRTSKSLTVEPGTPSVVRYADDLVALCYSQEQASQVKASLAEWLAPRGLTFNEDKTRVVHLSDGFDFLGFNVRHYGKLLIKPSKVAITRFRQRIASEFKALRGSNALAVIRRLNPIIKGWTAYYRTVVSKEIFHSLDHYVWQQTFKWALWTHPNKRKRWVVDRYFGQHNKFRRDKWVFGDRESGAYLLRLSWTGIVRHHTVKDRASPDDPALAEYWASRRNRRKPPLDPVSVHLLKVQNGRCAKCDGLLLYADREPQSPAEWEQWHRTTRKAIRKNALAVTGKGPADKSETVQIVHIVCDMAIAGRALR